MSFDSKSYIVSLLAADATLNGLLARYPGDATRPAIINSTMTDFTAAGKPVYPCVTFREITGFLESPFRPTPAEAGAAFVKPKFERFDFEIWDQSGDGGMTGDAIYQRLDAVLNGVTFTTTGGANVQQCVEIAGTGESQLDTTLKAWFRLVSYGVEIVYPN